MASVLNQTFFQPQVAMAISHFAGRVSSSRAMSTHKATRMQQKIKDRENSVVTLKEIEPMEICELSRLLHDAQHAVTTPTTALVKQARTNRNKWRESHVSAASFFENKTGFPPQQLDVSPNLHNLQAATKDPLFRRIFHSLAQSQYMQQRGFKTKRGQGNFKKSEVGGDSFLDNIQDLFGKTNKSSTQSFGSQPIGSLKMATDSDKTAKSGKKSDEDLIIIAKAFAEGFKTKEESLKQKKIRNAFLLVFTLFLLYQITGVSIKSEGGPFSILPSKDFNEVNAEDVNVTFEDVRGASEAKQELQDVVHFLRDPEKYTSLGAKLPKGVLLVGPPGVGKTLLARAVAGEAGVPFFHASGSEFDELFVGLGAKRIRQLFRAAKQQAPCIIFIDEFDSVGAKRTNSAIHPNANQTVNQLLSEMDGFQQNEGIIVMGATNKVDNMDKALRRPGRFDVEVTVSLPDLKGRKEIIELYISKITKDPAVDVEKLAKGTTGFSGAELENLINQAALKAVIDGRETVTMSHLEYARDKIIMGPERKHRIPDEETNWVTAFHEAGHTLVAYYTKDATPLHKVTIIPRGQSLGHTAFIDEKEVYNRTVSQLKASMDVGMGGRAAEDVIYGQEKVTTGASSDLQMATRVATAMVMHSGMSEKVGLRVFSDASDDKLSSSQREAIDSEIKRLLQESYERARGILTSHKKELDSLANALMKYETLDKKEIKEVIEGNTLDKIV